MITIGGDKMMSTFQGGSLPNILIIEEKDELPDPRFWRFKRFSYVFINENNKYKEEFKEHTLHTTSMLGHLWGEYFEFKDISEEIGNNFNLKRRTL
jgi:hypothetical protein